MSGGGNIVVKCVGGEAGEGSKYMPPIQPFEL